MIEKKETLFLPIPGPREKFNHKSIDYMKGIAGVKK
jgi:hypothetical protein